jgi:hypothetical protein
LPGYRKQRRAASFSHREKSANDPKVVAAKEKTIGSKLRKRKSSGLGLAAGNKAAKKQSRDIRFSHMRRQSKNSRIKVLKF